MKNKTTNVLIELGISACSKGFKYIVDAMILFENEEWLESKIIALYHKIAKDNNATVASVERAIRHAFGTAITKGNLELVEKYLSLTNTTNGNLLHVLYIRLKQEIEKEEK